MEMDSPFSLQKYFSDYNLLTLSELTEILFKAIINIVIEID